MNEEQETNYGQVTLAQPGDRRVRDSPVPLDVRDIYGSAGERVSFNDRLADLISEPFKIEVVSLAGIPLPIAVPYKGWIGMGVVVALVDIVNGNTGLWTSSFSSYPPNGVLVISLGQVVQGAPGINQNLNIEIVIPFYLSRMLFTTNSAIEAYIKITLLGVLWPLVILIDLIPPLIQSIVFAVAIGALSPAVLVAALGNVLSVIVSQIFRFIYNFVITVLCFLFGKGDVCGKCGCQDF
jgi:hypothetical protein